MDKKVQIMNIIYAAKYEGIDLDEATNDILSLFSVSQRSELLLFDDWLYENSNSEDKDRENIIDRYLTKKSNCL